MVDGVKMENRDLDSMRKELDSIDRAIIDLLHDRFKLICDIGEYKHKKKIAVMQESRVEEVLNSRSKWAIQSGMRDIFIKKLYKLIIEESCIKEEELMNKEKNEGENYEDINNR